MDVYLGVHTDTIGGGLAETTIQLVTVLFSPSASPPPPAAAGVVTEEEGSGDDREFVLADEKVQRGGDTGLNAVILVIAITTSLVVMCCAYYTVRFMRIKVKSVALSKQVCQYSILSLSLSPRQYMPIYAIPNCTHESHTALTRSRREV